MAEKLYVLNSAAGGAAFNMALDEALLEKARELDGSVLRFYGWTEPAASFGYFQNYGEVAALTRLRPLVRRPTGGGIVPHDSDWTYSLTIRPEAHWYSFTAVESYRSIHEWILKSFELLGIRAFLAPDCRAGAGQCFAGYEKSDVLYQGRKIAGAAQRRTRSGWLIQGSVQSPATELKREDWERAMCTEAEERGFNVQPFEVDPHLRNQTAFLMDKKYSQAAYNQKR